ncbi:hypothetical protein PHLGIDRAFT_290499 [Phlebiopsis gigantea 11061_1 CR5-6]|uniref:Uncharacterized protein n=1 Tax=Phlebiopsis gigantea (strain 11061_1 CR5-6) TaxID=745531 RepID=A0A0C3S3Q8_PHLG1|nr:hypothetical protein PHLGIDRAFT_290499 [Phlebiopsis gigantea 11061_1 CR5-6]
MERRIIGATCPCSAIYIFSRENTRRRSGELRPLPFARADTSMPDASPSSTHGLRAGAIAGVVISVITVALVIGLMVRLALRRERIRHGRALCWKKHVDRWKRLGSTSSSPVETSNAPSIPPVFSQFATYKPTPILPVFARYAKQKPTSEPATPTSSCSAGTYTADCTPSTLFTSVFASTGHGSHVDSGATVVRFPERSISRLTSPLNVNRGPAPNFVPDNFTLLGAI